MVISPTYRKSPTINIYLITLIGLCSLLACSNKGKRADSLTKVRVGITETFLGEAATFTAREQGFFKQNGLKVELESNSSGGVSIRELFRGGVDIAHVAETPVVYSLLDSSYYKKEPLPSFQIFADMMYATEVQHIVARKDHGITKPKDLIGKTIAVYKGTQLDYFFDSFLLESQIPKEKIKVVNMNPTEQVKAIIKGEIDVAITWEPYASYILQKLGGRAVSLEPQLSYSTLWLVTTLDSYAQNNPKVLINYLRSIKQAQDYIDAHPEETQQLLARKTGVPVDAVKASWEDIDYELSLSERMITLLEDQVRWMKRAGSVDTVTVNFREMINFGPMHTVHPRGITVIR